MSVNKDKTGPLFIFLSALLWSLSGIFTKFTAWNGICLAGLRGVIAFAAFAFLMRGKKIHLNTVIIHCAFCYFMQGILFITANTLTTAGNATVLQNVSPLFIILMNALFNHVKPKKKEIIVCLILFLGVGLTFAGSIGGGSVLGNILALLSAIFYAGVYFLSKQEGSDMMESLLFGNALYLLLLPYMLTNRTVLSTGFQEWILLILIGFLSCFGAWYCFSIGIKHTDALQAGFIALAEPVLAPLWTFLAFHEIPSPLSLAGIILVIVTLVLYNLQSNYPAEDIRPETDTGRQ